MRPQPAPRGPRPIPTRAESSPQCRARPPRRGEPWGTRRRFLPPSGGWLPRRGEAPRSDAQSGRSEPARLVKPGEPFPSRGERLPNRGDSYPPLLFPPLPAGGGREMGEGTGVRAPLLPADRRDQPAGLLDIRRRPPPEALVPPRRRLAVEIRPLPPRVQQTPPRHLAHGGERLLDGDAGGVVRKVVVERPAGRAPRVGVAELLPLGEVERRGPHRLGDVDRRAVVADQQGGARQQSGEERQRIAPHGDAPPRLPRAEPRRDLRQQPGVVRPPLDEHPADAPPAVAAVAGAPERPLGQPR